MRSTGDGRPVPLRWVARIEDASESGFTDRQVRGPFARWAHRHTFVRVTDDMTVVDDQIEADAMARATAAPYLLNADNLVIDVQSAESSGIGGVKQIDVTVSYAVRSIIPGLDADQFPMTLEKSIYVVDET